MSKKLEISDILKAGLDQSCDSLRHLSGQQWKVLNNLVNCHTSALGGHVYKCDKCNHAFATYNSCRDRHCPSCQSVARAAWVEHRLNELLPVGYFHMVFTVPQELNRFALNNKASFFNLLFRSVSQTLLTLGKDARWHGGTIGFICILHSWGQNLCEHPHIHCIIPGGGIREDGKKWKCFRNNYLFPVKVVSLLFRRLFLQGFQEYVENGKIKFHGSLSEYSNNPGLWESLITLLKRKQWVVYIKEPFKTPSHVIKYVGNYTHRIAIANSRLVAADENTVLFRWKDYRNPAQPKIMRLTLNEFIRRFLLHVLPSRFVRIRYYGFLSNHNRQSNIARCMRLLNKKYQRIKFDNTKLSILKRTLGKDPAKCKFCENGRYRLCQELMKKPKTNWLRYNTHTGPPYRETTLRFPKGNLAFGRSTTVCTCTDRKGRFRPFGEIARTEKG
jgi:hypothetical protein